jgi:hypothetical protein
MAGELFRGLMNLIFTDAITLLRGDYRAEVNTFTGDGFLAVFNLYSEDKDHLITALKAAFALRHQFKANTVARLRQMLQESLWDANREQVSRVLDSEFGLRIGVATTNPSRTVVATLGCDQRRQHSVFSEQLNALARGLSGVGAMERNKTLDFDTITFVTQSEAPATKTVEGYGVFRLSPLNVEFRGLEQQQYRVFLVEESGPA